MAKVTQHELTQQFPHRGMSDYLIKYGGEMAKNAKEIYRTRQSCTGKMRFVIRDENGLAYFGQSVGIDGMCGTIVQRQIPQIKWEREPYYDAA